MLSTGLRCPAALGLGAFALVISLFAAPAFGQAPPPENKIDNPKTITLGTVFDLLDQVEAADPASPNVDKLRAELKSLEADLQKKMAETQQLKLKIELLRTQEKVAEKAKGDKSAPHYGVTVRLSDDKGGTDEIILRKVDGVWKVVPSEGKGGIKWELHDVPMGGIRVAPAMPPAPPTPSYQPVPAPMRPGAGAPPHSDADKRIDNLERKLDRMMEILDQLRKEIDGPRRKAGAEDELRRAKELDQAAAEAVREKAKAALEEVGRGSELKRALEEAQYRLKEAEAQARAAEKEAEKKAKEAEKRAKEVEKKTSPKPESPRQ
jgi:hypothetical protein